MSDELARVARRVRVSEIAEDGAASLWHDDYEEKTKPLAPSLRDQVCGLMLDIRGAIPSDFSFSVAFEFNGVRVSVDFEDGNSGGFGGMSGGGFFTSRKSMLKKLRTTDWDKVRASALEQGAVFENMVHDADDRPANIPSSEEAAKKWASEIRSAIAGVRNMQPVPRFTLIAVQDGEDGVGFELSHFETRGRLVYTIADCMTCYYDVLAVLEDGVEWSYGEIEAAKAEAVEELGPISRAKAERRL